MAYKISLPKRKETDEQGSYQVYGKEEMVDDDQDPNADKTFKVGQLVKVRSDNDNDTYNSFKEKTLRITDVDKDFDKEGGYLYSFEDEDGREIGNSLYAWELEEAD